MLEDVTLDDVIKQSDEVPWRVGGGGAQVCFNVFIQQLYLMICAITRNRLKAFYQKFNGSATFKNRSMSTNCLYLVGKVNALKVNGLDNF